MTLVTKSAIASPMVAVMAMRTTLRHQTSAWTTAQVSQVWMVLKFQQDILVMMAEVYIWCLFLSVFIDDDVFANGLFLREQEGELGESQSGNLWICNQIYLIYNYSWVGRKDPNGVFNSFFDHNRIKKKKKNLYPYSLTFIFYFVLLWLILFAGLIFVLQNSYHL